MVVHPVDEPQFARAARRYCAESACCKRVFQVFHIHVFLKLFYMHVASVSCECCICCHDYTRKCSHIYYKRFIWMLHMFCNGYMRVFLVFQAYVAIVSTILDVCCKCRSDIAHVAVDPICSSCQLQLLDSPACTWVCKGREQRRGNCAGAG